ncbi:hypothetical protein A2801_04045 [Candidatus Woesebacteria bacterium RIFCSPHIGHO2_01_FULL_41_10]|uniref:GIY-YIG domain-containing protein n=1 Tax=Candidatus Woesebacteria bacterium RIFCSPHIGHO2_01_FULL_41_10 TaxID=1802500 RepID=A0A1F7YNW7_9BACT|nr:MAG: hypothetical protein A2801_04045 [Candidatus Woesebacteria bacterium RIFCSPHIGHO2_01_FULL_41_10]
MNHPQSLAFVDVETTGLNPRRHRVIEVGILRVENGVIVDQLNTVVQPHIHVPEEIFKMTGITPEEIARAPEFDEISYQIRGLLDNAIFIAHNARFDYAFMKHEFDRNGSQFKSKVLCTVRLSRRLFPGLPSYSLGSLIRYFGFSVDVRHRAYADAEVLLQLYEKSIEEFGEDHVAKIVNLMLKSSSTPSSLSEDIIEKLPERSGVYIFRGENEHIPLYVGKSVNIKERVKSHFSGDYSSPTDLRITSQIRSVEFIETAGEIGALIRESDTVKTLMPVYNRSLRRRHNLVVALRDSTQKYDRVAIYELEELGPDKVTEVMAVFKSKKQAKEQLRALANEYMLCPKLLGLENSRGRCFASQLGKCKGACTGDEDPVDYNMRFADCFATTKVKRWPFPKAIVIEETDKKLKECHVIDNWCYLGSLSYKDENDTPTVERFSPRFDWDIYKILVSAVLKSKASSIRQLSRQEARLVKQKNPKI